MGLDETIMADLKEAMKARDELRSSTLRMLKSELKYKQIELLDKFDEAAAHQVIRAMIKKRREAAEAFRGAGREDMALKEEQEEAILKTYLPAEIDDDALAKVVDEVIAELRPTGPQQSGPVVGAVMKRLKGQADGKRVGAMVRAKLGG